MSTVTSHPNTRLDVPAANDVSGAFVNRAGERFYCIRNVDDMPPFFISVISSDDHWLFVSSTGGLTAGRVSPDTALFPYITVDRIHESLTHTGPHTIVRLHHADGKQFWEPFNTEHAGRYKTERNLYKNVFGNKLCFEEINHSLELVFRYTWATSDEFGFVRNCEIENTGNVECKVEFLDGLLNVLPAGTPAHTQANASNLVDAYKWTELDKDVGLALYALYSGISDRAEPCESLRANVVYALGLDEPTMLLSDRQIDAFRKGDPVAGENARRGMRGSYFVSSSSEINAGSTLSWTIVANIERSQSDVVALRDKLRDPDKLAADIARSVATGCDELARIMGAADAAQEVAEETVSVHHCANVVFNVLRGGIFDDQYQVSARDFARTIRHFNRETWQRQQQLIDGLPEKLAHSELLKQVRLSGDRQLERLCLEYLPITFGRRHGDPSRPWNHFTIKLKDEHGDRLLSYEGNWRDIFQNWEALALSYPAFIEGMIAKFVNASTADGHNPYRITKEGIDWEVEDEEDPWSYIGYWGDHQIIYLQKLLELSLDFYPDQLGQLLHQPVFSYANVPYRIRSFDELLRNPKATVDFDHDAAERIEEEVARRGADAKLFCDRDGDVYLVTLLEKLLVTLLCKISNTVVDGGVWLNTQRPEWNDANNALVGNGLSMVTMYYLRRYLCFLQDLLGKDQGTAVVSAEVAVWLNETAACLRDIVSSLTHERCSDSNRQEWLAGLGQAASRYRDGIYSDGFARGTTEVQMPAITALLSDAIALVDHNIHMNRREDDLYHAYNLMNQGKDGLAIDTLYPMLEGQVAVLSSGALAATEAADVVDALFRSDIFRPDQKSFMLYPDRTLPGFLDKNVVPATAVDEIAILKTMIDGGDNRLVERDPEGRYRFNADLVGVGALNTRLDALIDEFGDEIVNARAALSSLYEAVFDHRSFTGRSGGMFGFEGLGCIYWHMVSKLLLAIQENYFQALDLDTDPAVAQRLGELYYQVRAGIGFNKTPAEYGAFPTDPYSHTPKHAGARQPGMTGQVKEEIRSRFGELGVCINGGSISLKPSLLRRQEFGDSETSMRYVDVDGQWQSLTVPGDGLAFTWCQVPFVYTLDRDKSIGLHVALDDGTENNFPNFDIPADLSRELFGRTGRIREITANLDPHSLFASL
jgi:hypothetical protein